MQILESIEQTLQLEVSAVARGKKNIGQLSRHIRSPAFTVPGRPAEGDQPNSPAFFLPASSFSASNAQSATSHFFPSRGREGGWQKDEATGVFWNKSIFSYRSVVTKK